MLMWSIYTIEISKVTQAVVLTISMFQVKIILFFSSLVVLL